VTHFETLAGVKSFEAAFELQTSYVKAYFEGFVSETTKLSEMYADLAKSAYKPYEAPIAAAVVKTAKSVSAATPAAA
jgi:hypothetical protein